jgi:4-diphosphocytidyl-2-C-methyl-D-erythritol kinase
MALRSLHDLPSPAKLNLFLHVVGRRADGYHLLQSAFVLIDWCDTIHVETRADGRLQRHDLGAPLPPDDLCLRAARALQQAAAAAGGANIAASGADITIAKRVPSSAGLGGGSSNAATVLLALNRLWQLHWPRQRLLELAQQLGADVPFFVGGGHAFVEGIGERLTPMRLAPQWFAVVKPPAAIATAEIFASAALKRDTEAVILPGSLAEAESLSRIRGGVADGALFGMPDADAGPAGGGAEGSAQWRNDLQPVAEAVCPDVLAASRWLRSRFGNSRMSGSGSAVFARAGMHDQPLATFGPSDLPSGWVGRMCRSLPGHPLAAWAG